VELSSQRYLALVMRLALNRTGSLDHGELVDENSKVLARFGSWPELTAALMNQEEQWRRAVAGE
jgi:hypothetical protein